MKMRESKLPEPLSQDELKVLKSTAEKNDKLYDLIEILMMFSALVSAISTVIFFGATSFYVLFNEYSPAVTWCSFAILAIFLTIATKCKTRLNSLLDGHFPADFESIESRPETCKKVNQWMSHDVVNEYVLKITAQGRFPIYLEYQTIEEFIKNAEQHEPVEALRKTMNLETA